MRLGHPPCIPIYSANSLESGKWIAPVDEGDSPQEARMWAWLYQKMADFVLRTTFPEAP